MFYIWLQVVLYTGAYICQEGHQMVHVTEYILQYVKDTQ